MEKTIITDFPTRVESGGYNRLKELKEFDDTKAGVKGLIDAGIQKLPRIFMRSPEELAKELPNGSHLFQVPIISLEGLQNKDVRRSIIDSIKSASEIWGCFQLVNHGLPSRVIEELIKASQRFFEQDIELKKKYYSRDAKDAVRYNTNANLYITKNAAWKDTLACFIKGGPDFSPHQLPEVCRHNTRVFRVCYYFGAYFVMSYYRNLLDSSQTMWAAMANHYYPKCPEPDLTLRTNSHFDPGFLAILLNNDVSGLQVFHQNHWVDVPAIPGSLIINIGHLLQIVKNDKFISEYHRVLASRDELRMSVATFFKPAESLPLGPIKELLSEDNLPKYYKKLTKDYLKEIYSAEKKAATIDDLKTQN